MQRFAVGVLFPFLAGVVLAQPSLRLPLECTLGKDCWISNHVDLDAGPGARDYACGTFTYNDHKGTDIALRDLAAMHEGVAVLAAADGVVLATRDRVEDVSVRERGHEAVAGIECGNAVRIGHGDGFQTMYCHLRRGSVAVKRGERVRAGQRLGLVGMSGLTEYPHLHFGVHRRGTVIDPFRGEGGGAECGLGERPLWDAETLGALRYAPAAIYNYGIASRPPPAAEVRSGAYRGRELSREAPAIVVWAEVYGVGGGERLHVRVEAPDGSLLFERGVLLAKPGARQYRTFGQRRGSELWASGTWWVTIAAEKTAEAGRAPIRFSFEVR